VDGKWVHLVCALTCPGTRIANLMDMGPVDLSAAAAHITYAPAAPTPKALPAPAPAHAPAAPMALTAGDSRAGAAAASVPAKAEEAAAAAMAVVGEGEEAEGEAAKAATSPKKEGPVAAPAAEKEEKEEEEGVPPEGTQAATEAEAATPVDGVEDTPTGEAAAEGATAEGKKSPPPVVAEGGERKEGKEREEEDEEQPQPSSAPDAPAAPASEKDDELPAIEPPPATTAAPSSDAAGSASAPAAPSTALVPAPACRPSVGAKGDQCGICGQSRGYTLRCSHAGCSARFHLLCAWFRGAYVSMSVTDRSFRGAGADREEYPAGLQLEAYCLEHCPPGTRDRAEQVAIRAQYRLKENEAAAAAALKRAHHHKKRATGGEGGRGFGPGLSGGREALPLDSYDKFACAVCLAPRAPLLQLDGPWFACGLGKGFWLTCAGRLGPNADSRISKSHTHTHTPPLPIRNRGGDGAPAGDDGLLQVRHLGAQGLPRRAARCVGCIHSTA
jgi:hypothetical protein